MASLARLELSADEVDRYREQLSQILDYVADLDAIDTSGVEPLSHAVPISAPMRDDSTRPSLPPDEALANAPARDETAFRVPPILAGE